MIQALVKTVDLFAIGPDGEKVSWSSFLGPMYEAMIVVQITLDNGQQGIAGLTMYTEHEFDKTAFHSASLMAPFLLGKGIYEIPNIYQQLRRKYVPMGHIPISLFDIALHDARAKLLNVPIYQMLGAARNKIRSYASSPLFNTVDEYVNYCQSMLNQGFKSIKIHPRCVFEEDIALVHSLQEAFRDTDIGWSLDVDSCYNLEQSLKMGRLLDKYQWEFFEEPMPDADLESYKVLADALDIDVICGGNSLPNLFLIKQALQMRAWDRSRFDVTSIGGFTGANHVMGVTLAHGMKAEVQSWGYTLTQAANLHFMLTYHNCDYLEQAAPYDKYEVGAKQVFRPDNQGYVHPNDLPGLGVELDWNVLDPFIYQQAHFQ